VRGNDAVPHLQHAQLIGRREKSDVADHHFCPAFDDDPDTERSLLGAEDCLPLEYRKHGRLRPIVGKLCAQ
jgi:hypothetical protein